MNEDLSRRAQRVQTALTEMGVDCQVVELPNLTRTAQDAADAIGCTVAQIVKSLLFQGRESGAPILVVASGINRVDERKLRTLLGEKVRRPDASFVREKSGYAIGGVPPLGHAVPIRTFIDRDLLQYDTLWAAAGTPYAVFRLTPAILQRITHGEVADLA